MKKLLIALFSALSLNANADITISGMYGNDKIEMTSCDYVAGVICSLKYKDLEFINGRVGTDGKPVDKGRQMQSASSFNDLGELYNPTQAGAVIFDDGVFPSTTKYSKMLGRWWADNHVGVRTQMAFWNAVVESPSNPYKYVFTSNHTVQVETTIGVHGFANVILYKATFSVPYYDLRVLTKGQFEVTTAYMQTYFNTFYILNDNRNLSSVADIQQEQNKPVIFSTSDGQYAMGIYSPEAPQPEYPFASYGVWRFNDCVKMNYVVRVANPKGTYKYRAYYIVGSLSEVQNTMNALRNSNLPSLGKI